VVIYRQTFFKLSIYLIKPDGSIPFFNGTIGVPVRIRVCALGLKQKGNKKEENHYKYKKFLNQ